MRTSCNALFFGWYTVCYPLKFENNATQSAFWCSIQKLKVQFMKIAMVITGLLFLTMQGFSQTTHQVSVAVNQPEGCSIVDALDVSQLFEVFPNPATSSITIQSEIQNAELRLVNLEGKEVRVETLVSGNLKMEVGDLGSGAYVLFFDHDNGTEKVKIIIQ